MLTEIRQPGKQLNQDDILVLNRKLISPVPDEYRDFLIQNNGGEPKESTLTFDAKKLGINGEELGYFYGIDTESENIIDTIDNLSHVLPKNLIPIVDTPGGNYFLLSVNPNTYGKIYYKDHEVEDSFDFDDSKNDLPESMVLVANLFSEFIDKLYDPDEE